MATPIGNLADISLRALAVLARADLIAAEDTRHSKKLLTHFGIAGELTPYHEHNAEKERPRLVGAAPRRAVGGADLGRRHAARSPIPATSWCARRSTTGIMVTSIPGPRPTLAALTSAGLPTDTFLFAGFLPPKSGPRRARLEELKTVPATLLFFETGPRLAKSLADMADVLGAREAAIAKELTKLHESVTRGTARRARRRDCRQRSAEGRVRGGDRAAVRGRRPRPATR